MVTSETAAAKTILVVDDDEVVLSYLKFALQGDGFLVQESNDAEKAFKLLEKKVPDLILLDIMLPRMDGFTMCKTMRGNPKLAKVPVLFITAYADQNNVHQVAEVGAQGLIEKPIMYSELLTHIYEAMAGRFSLPTRLKFSA